MKRIEDEREKKTLTSQNLNSCQSVIIITIICKPRINDHPHTCQKYQFDMSQ